MLNRLNRIILFAAMSGCTLSNAAQLTGNITNKQTGQPIPDANITVLNTRNGAVSRDGGFYFIDDLQAGEHQIQVRVIGYRTAMCQVSIPEQTTLDIELEPKIIEFDPVVITATLSEHRQSNITLSADVLTKTSMTTLNGNTAGEIVESVGGLYSKSYDGFAGLNTPSIRGSQASQVLILMDGIRLNTAQGGSVDLNTIPIAAVDRIEVIKGGHSALLGSDAIGGVIHFLSGEQYQKGFHYGVSSTLGSFGTGIYSVRGSHQAGCLGIFVGYSHLQSDGDFNYKAPKSGLMEKRVNNDSKTGSLFLKTKFNFNTLNSLQVSFHRLDTERGIAGNVNISPWTDLPQTTPRARSDSDRNILTLTSSHQMTPRLLLKSQAGYHAYEYRYRDPDGWPPADDLHENKALNANVQAIYAFNAHLTTTGGLNIQKDDLKSTRFTLSDSRTLKSIYGQTELKQSVSAVCFTWIPAVRWDSYNDVGSHTSPKLGVMVSAGETGTVAVRGNISKSYRVPTFEDLYWPADEYTAGNPDLLPETGTGIDVGVLFSDHVSGWIQAELTWFSNRMQDMIEWQPGPDYVWRPTNVGKAEVTGLESSIKFRLPFQKAYMNIYYTRMKATDETEGSANKGKRLIYRPDNKCDIIAGIKQGILSANVNGRLVGKSYTTADNSASLGSYLILGANIAANIPVSGIQLTLRFQGLNLTDERIFLSDGYPLPGREFRITVGVEH
jgi:outer membrane cobalamin receptor